MTILITNLKDCLEDISDDEMQQLSGGISISFDVYPSEARNTPRNRRTGNIIQDAAIGAGAGVLLASLGQRFALAATYVTGTSD